MPSPARITEVCFVEVLCAGAILVPSSTVDASGAGAAVLAFSTTDRDSFDALPKWKEKVIQLSLLRFVAWEEKQMLDRRPAQRLREARDTAALGWHFSRQVTREVGDIAMALVQNKVDLIDQVRESAFFFSGHLTCQMSHGNTYWSRCNRPS